MYISQQNCTLCSGFVVVLKGDMHCHNFFTRMFYIVRLMVICVDYFVVYNCILGVMLLWSATVDCFLS